MGRRCKVVAHRGASGCRPENTRAAFEEAIRLHVDTIEFDVQLTADGQLVIIHDDRVDRTSDGHGRIADLTLESIKRLDAGSWFGAAFAGERFLTLAETLDLMPRGMGLNVHVKARPANREAIVSAVLQELVGRDLLDSAFMASDEETLALARGMEPRLEICNLSVAPVETYVARSLRIGCRILQPGNGVTTTELVSEAHAAALEVNPFYADSVEEMNRLMDCGVDGILTNEPALLQRLLNEVSEQP